MDFIKLFRKLSVHLSEFRNNFKEMKWQAEITLEIPELSKLQLPSDFFTTLQNYGKVSRDNLMPLYEIYENSQLPYEAKSQAFKYIQEFNFHQYSYQATLILQQVILSLVTHPLDTNEMKRLVEWVPDEERTQNMLFDHRASLGKLIELGIIHAFDFRVLRTVFINNSNVINTIIDPAWRRVLDLDNNYIRNHKELSPQRPSNIRIRTPPGSIDPSPIDSYTGMRAYPNSSLPRVEHWSPVEHPTAPETNPSFHRYPVQATGSPNYENPSPTAENKLDSILNDVQYDIPERDILNGTFPGECLIINIEKFEVGSNIKNRIGSNIDVENIKKTFEELKFKVTIKSDFTSEGLIRYLKEKSCDESLSKVGVFVCFLMSHGEEGRISGSDGRHVEIDTIVTIFKNDLCIPLRGKPKTFFVQACRGNVVDNPKKAIFTDNVASQPQDADVMICQATTKGKVAVRTDEGSWYIRELCGIIMRGYRDLDLMQIHTKVNYRVSELGIEASTLQVSNSSGSLRKTLKFVPNIPSRTFLNGCKQRYQ